MPMIRISGKKVERVIELPSLDDFPKWIKIHQENLSKTEVLEQAGSNLVTAWDGKSWPLLFEFIKGVLVWGKVTRGWNRVFYGNYSNTVCRRFSYAIDALNQEDIASALNRLDKISGFGLSIASKHLRFLNPDLCPVLDDVLRKHLGYSESTAGYLEFCDDLRAVRDALNLQIKNPIRTAGNWKIADVESAIFSFFYYC